MAVSLVECIPNFSEARRPENIREIINSIQFNNGIKILDTHSDLDHNRTVVTFIGSPKEVEEAAYRAIKKAASLIDLNFHSGEHPRIGATDVVPFVPIRNVSMQECVDMARRLGKRVSDDLGIPVYLYEEAAASPERTNLENIRRGQYEGLKQEIKTDPARKPDFGPNELGPAGATVIGARQPLIAYNVYLTTDDVKIAQKIAKAVRHSSGGFRFVKAMGILVDGRAQVSMNLTNFRQTPIARVVETIRNEAVRYGVAVHHCELVGMIPQEALVDAAVWYLQLDDFKADQILEQKLAEATAPESAENSKKDFIEELATATPTPGGGAAAAHTAAVAAALVSMVCRLTIGKKKYMDVEAELKTVLEKSEELRSLAIQAVDQDVQVFNLFMEASHLPKDTEEQTSHYKIAIEKASLEAARVPLTVAKNALLIHELANIAAEKGNLNAISDAASAAAFAKAAFTSAGLNVRINLTHLAGNQTAISYIQELLSAEKELDSFEIKMNKIIDQRSQLNHINL